MIGVRLSAILAATPVSCCNNYCSHENSWDEANKCH